MRQPPCTQADRRRSATRLLAAVLSLVLLATSAFVTTEARSFTGVTGDPGTGTQTFTYDALGRVTGSTGLASGSRTYTYDRDSNRLTKTEGGITFTYAYDRTDELLAVIKTGGTSQTFTYDPYGNQTGDAQTGAAVTAMAYDLTGHLTAIDAAGTANDATFTLDALGRFRTRVLNTGGTDTYSYIDTSEVVTRIANAGGSGTTTDSIVSPTGDRLGVTVAGTLNWFLPDLHGDIAASLDSGETTVVNAIRYDAYGQTIVTGTAGGTKVGADAWKYQGRLDISPAGLGTPLYDMSARFYNPGTGAFTQFDSVLGTAQNPLSMHRFLYAAANPATLTDPTGHCPFCLLLIPIAIGFAAGAGVDAGIQQVTTGTVDWGQAGVSGAIGAFSGGVGGVAAAGARSAVTAIARPVIARGIGYAAGIGTQAVVAEGLGAAFVPKDEQDDPAQNLAVGAATQVGADVAIAAAKRLPGKFGAIGRFFDGVFSRGGGKVDEPGVSGDLDSVAGVGHGIRYDPKVDRYRSSDGRFAVGPDGPSRPATMPSEHGNSRQSSRPATLYQRVSASGEHQKFGVSQDWETRYTRRLLGNDTITPRRTGTRAEMLDLEYRANRRYRGPMNHTRFRNR